MQHFKAVVKQCLPSQRLLLKHKRFLRYLLISTSRTRKVLFEMLRFVTLIVCCFKIIINHLCMQALELGLGGVVLKVKDVEAVLELKVICYRAKLLQ